MHVIDYDDLQHFVPKILARTCTSIEEFITPLGFSDVDVITSYCLDAPCFIPAGNMHYNQDKSYPTMLARDE